MTILTKLQVKVSLSRQIFFFNGFHEKCESFNTDRHNLIAIVQRYHRFPLFVMMKWKCQYKWKIIFGEFSMVNLGKIIQWIFLAFIQNFDVYHEPFKFHSMIYYSTFVNVVEFYLIFGSISYLSSAVSFICFLHSSRIKIEWWLIVSNGNGTTFNNVNKWRNASVLR